MEARVDVRDIIKKALSAALETCGVSIEWQKIVLEHPAELKNGDHASSVALSAYSAFQDQVKSEMNLEKRKQVHYGKVGDVTWSSPKQLAEQIKEQMGLVAGVEKIEVAGPGFINFYLAPSTLAHSVKEAINADMWGSNANLSGKKIMVEYTDPNPFKEFHIGHLMSNAIGESLSRLLQFSGAEIKRANYQGDVGPHVAKAIYGMRQMNWKESLLGKKEETAALGVAYATGSAHYEINPEVKKEIDEINKKIYEGSDTEINELYAIGRELSLEHFEEIYKILGTKFDYYFFESVAAPKGLVVVRTHPQIFTQSDGAIVYKGEQDGLHTRVFITSKGLPTYETKELGLAQLKEETWSPDFSITVTAHEQADYFAVVLAAMQKVLPEIAPKIQHISHGMMRLQGGKMSSRTGDVITGEYLLNELIEQAKIRANESRAHDHEKLAQDVAVAAIKYQILRQVSGKDIIFDRERALSLEGDSGPYLQYAHARTQAIMQKAEEGNVRAEVRVDDSQSELARLLHRFPEIVERAGSLYEPHVLTNYLVQVAGTFNSWYANEQILDGTPAASHKVALTAAVSRTLKNGLWMLGIPAPEKM